MNIVSEMDFCYLSKQKATFPKKQIRSSLDAYEIIRQFYHDDIDIYESFFILLLNRALVTIGYAKISQGGIASCIVDTKIVCKYVVDTMASAVILAHNHPSGQLVPSDQDKKVTNNLVQCLKYFDCIVSDHLILTSESYYSFADSGIL